MSKVCSTLSTLALSAAVLAQAPAHAADLEPATQAFIDSLAGGKPIYTLPVAQARDVLEGAQNSVPVALAPVTYADREIPVGPTGRTAVRIYRPEGAKGDLPVVVYAHGGGWVLGSKTTHDRLVRELAVGANAVVVFVDFDRSPEARYPVAIEQTYGTLTYVAAHPAEFGADATRIALAGDSVGGNMTAVAAIMAKERKGPKLAAQVLIYPVTDASMSSGSYTTFADGPWLTKKAMEWFWDQYLPEATARGDIHVSPINATTDQLHGLPRALVITDENDVLRDEGEAYGRHLAAAGVTVTSMRFNGTIHDFLLLNPLAQTPAVRGAIVQATAFLRNAFAK